MHEFVPKNKKSKKLIIIAVIILIGAVLVATPFFAVHNAQVKFNQHFIQSTELAYEPFADEYWDDYIASVYPHGLKLLFTPPENRPFNHSDPVQTFEFLFDRMPDYAIVYPTETYYYYSFQLPEIEISGNMRFLDAHEGKIHIGYFDKNQPHGETFYTVLTQEDGVHITQLSDYLFEVTYKGTTKTVKLTDIASKPPQTTRLLPEEKFIAHIIDESAITLFLLFNNETFTFYYLLDEEKTPTTTFKEVAPNYLQDQRTHFIFYHDQEFDRKILVGVSRQNIFENNYFDGAFDQVPPRLPIREKLHAAYPYTQYAGGIDEHGNFYGFEGSRVAISPYYDYETIDDLLAYLSRCDENEGKSLFWSCLTYEWKKDFHKTLEEQNYTDPGFGEHPIYVSQGWPANHDGTVSVRWPQEHEAQESGVWPPNHDPVKSNA